LSATPFGTGAAYLNFTHEADRVRDAYGDAKYARLLVVGRVCPGGDRVEQPHGARERAGGRGHLLSQMVIFRIGQGVAAVPDAATVFSHRDAKYISGWLRATRSGAWPRNVSIAPSASLGRYWAVSAARSCQRTALAVAPAFS